MADKKRQNLDAHAVPFFARYLEGQLEELSEEEAEAVGGGYFSISKKHPFSCYVTKKYPSDCDEGPIAVTLKFPSDWEDGCWQAHSYSRRSR